MPEVRERRLRVNNGSWRRTQGTTTERQRAYRLAIKLEVMEAYGGPVCTCCGETELIFLVIDHVNEDGAQQRRRIRSVGGYGFYQWLRVNDFPPGFQVLCHNCNWAKSRGGCPHKVRGLLFSVGEPT